MCVLRKEASGGSAQKIEGGVYGSRLSSGDGPFLVAECCCSSGKRLERLVRGERAVAIHHALSVSAQAFDERI